MKVKRSIASLLAIVMLLGSIFFAAPSLQVEAANATKITLNRKTATVNVGSKVTLKATKDPKSASGTIKWSSTKKSIAKVSNKGVVTGVKAGTATITASLKSGSKTLKANCKVAVKAVRVTSVKVSVSKKILNVGENITIKPTVKPKNATNKNLTYKSANTKVATVSSKGIIAAKAAGTVKITTTAKDGSKKNASVTITVVVPAVKVSEVKTDNSKITLDVGKTQKLNITVLPSNATNKIIKFSSTKLNVADVSEDGMISAKAQGNTSITAESTDGSNKKVQIEVIVVVPEVKVSELKTENSNITLNAGEAQNLNITVLPSGATNKKINFSSSDLNAAVVSEDGLVTAKAQGSTVITAESTDGSNKKVQINITVTNKEKVRTIVTTDGEVDDMDSFIRQMLYANEMDLAGLILSSSRYHYAGDPENEIEPYRWTGTQWASDVLDNYAAVYENLKVHSDGYPTPDYLKSIYKIGNIKSPGEMEDITEGSEFMKEILLDDDDRDIYIQTWGGTNTTARALKSIEKEYKDTPQWNEIYKKVTDKAIIYIILNQDVTYSDYIAKNWSDIRIINDSSNFGRIAYGWKSTSSELITRFQGDWMYPNIKKGHGSLLENYVLSGDGTMLEGEVDNEQRGSETYLVDNPTYNRYDFISEGDSPSFFYLIDNGLRSLEDPTYGGWGGRFGVAVDGTYKNTVSDYNPYSKASETHYTLTRWFNDIQSDFGARADWCVESEYSKANHRPTVEVEEGLDITAKPGQRIKLHANAADPDGDKLTYSWWQYYEADTYKGSFDGNMSIIGADTHTASFEVPQDAKDGDTIHMVIQVKDNVENYMTHYQRVIITVSGGKDIDTLAIQLPAGVDKDKIPFGTASQTSSLSPYAVILSTLVNGSSDHYKTYEWKSSNTTVATVSSSGVLTPRALGDVTVTITAKDGSGKTASIDLTIVAEVTEIIASVTISGSKTIEVGGSTTLSASVLPTTASNKAVNWSSGDTSVATVSSSGLVTGVAKGTATIRAASRADLSKVGTYEITVTKTFESVNTGKVRTIVTTDGEVDDMDSFIRLMLYSNEMDLAGLVLTSSTYHYAGDPSKDIAPYRWTGTQWASEILERYADVYENLKVHADGYPEPEYLESILKIGNIKNVGEMEEITEGSEFMKEILLDDDDRELYIQTWGGTNTTARALKSIEDEYKNTPQWDAIYKKVSEKAIIYIILNQDATYSNYIAKSWPDISVINDGGNFWRFAYMWKNVRTELTGKLQGDWMYQNIKTGHGSLLEYYKLMGDGTVLEGELDNEQRGIEDYLIRNPQYNRYDFISEGDSPSFFYLLDTGLRSMEDPTYGGWGGRFGVADDGTYKNTVSDYNPYSQASEMHYTLTRWFDDIQSDFGARADWCVTSDYSKANHRPTVTVTDGLDLTAKPGERVKLQADATDPDGDKLTYSWWQYYEADMYKGSLDDNISIIGATTNTASFVIPEDAKNGDTIHMIIQVKDNAENYMTHYQRVIITVKDRQEIDTLTLTTNDNVADNKIAYNASSALRTLKLTYTLTPEEGMTSRTFTWTSSDTSIVSTVSAAGVMTIPATTSGGSVTIMATANDGSGKSVSITLTIVPAQAPAASVKIILEESIESEEENSITPVDPTAINTEETSEEGSKPDVEPVPTNTEEISEEGTEPSIEPPSTNMDEP